FSRLADALLDVQYVRGDERVYDDCGWTLGYSKNVEWKRIVNQDILKTPMREWSGKISGSQFSAKGKAVAIKNYADTDLIRLRYELSGAKFSVSDAAWKQKNTEWPAGTVFIPLDGIDSKKLEDAFNSVSLEYSTLD